MTERRALPKHLDTAAEVLETHFEEIFAVYEGHLLAISSPLVAEAETREQLRAQAQSILAKVAADLRGREARPDAPESEDRLSENIGVSRARKGVHPSESLRAVAALSEAALSVVVDNLPPSPTARSELAAVALTLQTNIMDRVAKAAVAYTDHLLERVHKSHVDERRRISRELHDRVAHSIMVAFRNLEIYEIYSDRDPSKARTRLELAKSTAQEALELTRNLSRELRITSAEEGLEVALSELLDASVPQNIRSWVSVEGDESLIAPQIRDELFLVLREGIRNAVAHSGAGTIKVELNATENQVRAAVEDDGQGFKPGEEATRAGGAGLASMEERTSLLSGALTLASEPGKGTRIEVFVPLPRRQG